MRALTTITLATLALATQLSVCAHAEDAPSRNINLAEVYGNAALVGMQLSVQKRASDGSFPTNVAVCLSALPSSTFNNVFDTAIKDNLSADEIAAATAFFASPAGQKYAKTAIAQIYTSMGMKSPEAIPEFSATEYTELAKFTHTSAGDKLIIKRILEGGIAHQDMGTRVQELLHSCNESVAKR